MIVKLVGSGSELENLSQTVALALSELGLSDFVKVESVDDAAYKTELGISQNPALCIEEDSIEFKDMIFEGSVPEKAELVSMFASIFGGATDESSCSSDACGSGCGSCSGH
jgi:hypothetical protein